ncbi:DNA mismatch repair protein MutS [Methylobacterium haplocladii]|uniref:DNA mismatch repair protein MutS n=2 Tax=Methylobacterium haplocladii TaxID=1176176 RepID=A0A512IJ56_9HYPH|nr:DNA mismatch repair protein MutS [Methylobacterium haplocladii]GEO97747.1 DNA mismatch repair protein MutS [Methylobacterium haplocladii]GJD84063.1 DNA mismatch repair protein MutS [Methylobacterium haplocladii]
MSRPALRSIPLDQHAKGADAVTKEPPSLDRVGATPMMAQYIEIKAANPDCLLFYRMGDFFELFFEDAEIASRALGIVLTKRGKHGGNEIPMCGVPVERSDDYLSRLIALGHRVAVCQQVEDPAEAKKRGPKSVVRREVQRLVTPGTITEDRLLDPARANLLLAVGRRKISEQAQAYGLAAIDISTGRFSLSEVADGELAAAIARHEPREIVLSEAIHSDPALARLWRDTSAAVVPLAQAELEPASAERRIREQFGVATLDGFGAFSRAEIAAAGAALLYIERTQIGARVPLSAPTREASGATLSIDAATRANLELTRTLSGERKGSLLDTIDRTVSAGGARLLAEHLAGPLTDLEAIVQRQAAVAYLTEEAALRGALRDALAGAPDLARALSRTGLGRAGPRDLAALRDGLDAAARIAERLASLQGAPRALAAIGERLAGIDSGLVAELAAALADDLPLNRRDGGFVRAGYRADIDESRELGRDSRKVIAALQARYAEESGCRTLRIKHNNMLGFYIEVPQAVGEACLKGLMRDFVHRQTMIDAMRFTSVELGELESKISGASDRVLAMEGEVFEALAALVMAQATVIADVAEALAALDVAASHAELAVELDWTRPGLDAGVAFAIEGGRHPVVEAALRRSGEPFIANDCDLSGKESGRIRLVTGPNMGGKSTFLRQNALIVVLAQMGAFVPARSAHLGLVDRLFSRVGAADDLARGHSTFMVEMVETAAILNQATRRSLVVLDEIGRGTATFDGLSIAWACLEHLHETNGCRSLFATHFHELTALSQRLSRLDNATLRVTEHRGDVVFLHEVVPGVADKSYGLQVARLAGLPKGVVARAGAILKGLEASERDRPTRRKIDDLPLFASLADAPPSEPAQAVMVDDTVGALVDELDPDAMTPREALDALYRLKRERARKA